MRGTTACTCSSSRGSGRQFLKRAVVGDDGSGPGVVERSERRVLPRMLVVDVGAHAKYARRGETAALEHETFRQDHLRVCFRTGHGVFHLRKLELNVIADGDARIVISELNRERCGRRPGERVRVDEDAPWAADFAV